MKLASFQLKFLLSFCKYNPNNSASLTNTKFLLPFFKNQVSTPNLASLTNRSETILSSCKQFLFFFFFFAFCYSQTHKPISQKQFLFFFSFAFCYHRWRNRRKVKSLPARSRENGGEILCREWCCCCSSLLMESLNFMLSELTQAESRASRVKNEVLFDGGVRFQIWRRVACALCMWCSPLLVFHC